MSSPTWPTPRTLSSPETPAAQMSHSGPAFYRPPKKGPPDHRAKYGVYDQNGAAGGNGVPSRYIPTGPSGEILILLQSVCCTYMLSCAGSFRSTSWPKMKVTGMSTCAAL